MLALKRLYRNWKIKVNAKGILPIVLFLLLSSCIGNSVTNIPTSDTSNKNKIADSVLLDYFPIQNSISFTIETRPEDNEFSYKKQDCIPDKFNDFLSDFSEAQNEDASLLKPISKSKIDSNTYFLILAIQSDYGPVYYGSLYLLQNNQIQKTTEIAWSWGDAGDSQTAYSKIKILKNGVEIKKIIQTCHDSTFDEVIITEETVCKDSTVRLIFTPK